MEVLRELLDRAINVLYVTPEFVTENPIMIRRRMNMSRVPVLALTAPATPHVQQDVCDILRMKFAQLHQVLALWTTWTCLT